MMLITFGQIANVFLVGFVVGFLSSILFVLFSLGFFDRNKKGK